MRAENRCAEVQLQARMTVAMQILATPIYLIFELRQERFRDVDAGLSRTSRP